MGLGAVAKGVVQWIVVPIALLVVGYYILGPQIGSKASAKTRTAVENTPPPVDDGVAPPVASGDVAVHSGEPEVSVTVKRGGMFRANDFTPDGEYRSYSGRRRRRHSRRSNSVDDSGTSRGRSSANLDTSTDSSFGAADSTSSDTSATPRRHRRRHHRSSSPAATTPSDTGDGTTGGTGGTTG